MSQFDGESSSFTTLAAEEEPPDVPLSSLSASASLSRRNAGLHVPLEAPPLVSPRRISGNRQTRAFRRAFYPDVAEKQWTDWRWQLRHRLRSLEEIERILDLSDEERQALQLGAAMLPVGVTPYYASLLSRTDPLQPLRRTVVPTSAEFVRTHGEADDPLGEDKHSPVPGLVHRYPDRVLLLAHDYCSTY